MTTNGTGIRVGIRRWWMLAGGSVVLAVIVAGCGAGMTGEVAAPGDGKGDAATRAGVEGAAGALVERVYDVRDLLVPIDRWWRRPEDEAAWGERGAETRPARAEVRRPTTREATLEIAKTLRETVAPQSWARVGAIRESNGQLIVTQTRDAHAEIARLFEQLRKARAVIVMVEIRLLPLLPEELVAAGIDAALVGSGKADAIGATRPAGAARSVTISQAQVTSLLKGTHGPPCWMVTTPRLTLFSGMRATVASASRKSYVRAYRVTRVGGVEAYEAVRDEVESGYFCDTEATASADRKFVTVRLRPRVRRLTLEDVRWPGGPPGQVLMVQRPKLEEWGIDTAATMPAGETLLLGGIGEGYPWADEEGADRRSEGKLYMLLKPMVGVQSAEGRWEAP